MTLGICQFRPARTSGRPLTPGTRAVSQPGWLRSASSASSVNSAWFFPTVILSNRRQRKVRLERDGIESPPRSRFLIEHDLRANASRLLAKGKPLYTFPDHALAGIIG